MLILLSIQLTGRQSQKRASSKPSVPAEKNQRDVALLYDDPHALLSSYQNIIQIIVGKFSVRGLFLAGERDDVVQFINEKLLSEKLEKIRVQYNGASYLSTYFSRIVQNLCYEYHRKFHYPPTSEVNESTAVISPDFGKLLIEEELRRFAAILKMFNRSAKKLLLCLRLISRAGVTPEELQAYCPDYDPDDIVELAGNFKHDNFSLNDKDIYELLTPFFNKCEDKERTADALRKWLDDKVREIITLLNGNPPRANYDKETLKILVQKFFESDRFA